MDTLSNDSEEAINCSIDGVLFGKECQHKAPDRIPEFGDKGREDYYQGTRDWKLNVYFYKIEGGEEVLFWRTIIGKRGNRKETDKCMFLVTKRSDGQFMLDSMS